MTTAGRKTKQQLLQIIEDQQAELAEARETLRAIREGEVDAIVVSSTKGEQIFSLVGAESIYRLIVETMKEAAFTVTFDCRILFCNAQFGELVKCPIEQIVGHPLQEFVPPESRDGVESLLATSQHKAVRQRLVFQNAEGVPVPAHVSSNVINQPDGLSICIVAADLTDLENSTAMLQRLRSQQQELHDSQTLLRAVMEGTSDPVYVKDREGRILLANPALAAVVGKPLEAILGRTDGECYGSPAVGRQLRVNDQRIMASGQSEVMEETVPTPLGDRTFLSSKSPHRSAMGEIIGIIGISRDITERKQSEEALRRSEQNYRTLAESERAARSEAEQANRMKDEFLANLSHELRGPLNPILGWVQILQKSNFDEKVFRQGLGVIERSARAQTQLISDLLDMSRVVSGKLRLNVQSCYLPAVLEAAIDSEAAAARAKSIRIEKIIDSSGPILGDPSRLQQVFWNILSNAIKFTQSQGKVQIVARRINSHVEVRVSDTGQGIKPDFLPYVFERFWQADSSAAKRRGGLGLGLAIVKHLVELHGGTVRAESPGEGRGATFIVTLPIMAVRAEAGEPSEPGGVLVGAVTAESINLAGIKVLVVDDESDTRHVITRLLEERGAEVRAAGSASEGIALLQEHKPDVLIGDIGMPDVDGYEMIRRIRSLPAEAGGETPAVALTAFSRVEERNRALLAGYQYHLAKPVEFAELAVTLATITKRIPHL